MEKINKSLYQQARLSRDARFDGKFYIAVLTTGIFCRTTCPAKLPLEKNVLYIESRELAMAKGFRPCLRCKPEHAPTFDEVDLVSSRVTSIMKAIQSGSLLFSTVQEIADLYSTSTRNLNKSFSAKIGISLKEYQSINKAFFIKKLIADSNLSITEIANVCGYSSLSGLYSFIDKRLKIKKFSDSTISKKIKESYSGYFNLNFPLKHAFNWNYFLAYHKARLIESIERIDGSTFFSTFTVNDLQGSFYVKIADDVAYVSISKNLTKQLPAAIAKVTSFLDLNCNTTVVERLLSEHYPLINFQAGIRIPGVLSAYEAGIRAICGQQVSISAATNLLNQFVKIFRNVDSNGVHYFPTPASITLNELQKLKTTNSKINTIYNFSQWCANNEINSLQEADDLISIKGIGKWTIDYIKLRAFNCSDVWMGTDLGIKKLMEKSGELDLRKASPWKSYLTLHCWNNL